MGVSTSTDTPRRRQFHLNSGHIHQRRLRRRIDEDVEVAAIRVLAVQHGAEYPGIPSTMRLDHMPDRCTVRGQGFMRSPTTQGDFMEHQRRVESNNRIQFFSKLTHPIPTPETHSNPDSLENLLPAGPSIALRASSPSHSNAMAFAAYNPKKSPAARGSFHFPRAPGTGTLTSARSSRRQRPSS